MKPQNPIQDELQQLGIQLPIAKKSPMSLPEGYFADFSNMVLEEVRTQQFLDSLPKNLPFVRPTFSIDIFEESLKTALTLEQLPKNMPYEVPTQYFEELSSVMVQKMKQGQPSLGTIRPFRSIYANLAVAATLFLFVAIGFLLINQKEQVNIAQQLNVVSDTEIQAYIQAHQNEFNTDLSMDRVEDDANIDIKKLENEVFQNQLKNLTDEELASYL